MKAPKNRIRVKISCGLLLAAFLPGFGHHQLSAEIRLPAIFADNMVLQRDSDVKIWGWGEPGESVTLTASWLGNAVTRIVNADGKWSATLRTGMNAGPHELAIQSDRQSVAGQPPLKIVNILHGEVWVCSGQSNMEWPLTVTNWYEETKDQPIAEEETDLPMVRLFNVQRATATTPQEDCVGSWQPCKLENAKPFSAVGFFFGRELHRALHGVPIGMIETAWGGTRAEAWTRKSSLLALPGYEQDYAKEPSEPVDPNYASALSNGMLMPIVHYRIRGAIWYQGESNHRNGRAYRTLFPAMIRDWRNAWGIGDFSFYFVQIAPFRYDSPDIAAAELREAQLLSLAVPNTGMAVITDIGNLDDIHPRNKRDVGKRLALWALAKDYGQSVAHSGPLYESHRVEGSAIRIFFNNVADGFLARDGALTEFQIAAADQEFLPAEAQIDGDTILVRSAEVAAPVAVRFGFSNVAVPNLFNSAGLPASPFRTDDW